MAIGASYLSDESTGANHFSYENTGSIYIDERTFPLLLDAPRAISPLE
jgi:hypothetical protein